MKKLFYMKNLFYSLFFTLLCCACMNGQGAWIPLTDINAVAPCGTSDPNEQCDTYVVVPKNLSSGRDLLDNSLAMRIFWYVFRFLLYLAAVLALGWFVMVTFVTDKGNCDKWLLPFLSVVLWIFASVPYPHWYMVLAVPVAMMMFVYPLFFTYRAGRFFLSHLAGTALLAAFYMLLYNSALGKSSFILGLLSVLLATGIALWMEHRCRKYFCPHCHYYGKHEDMGFTDKGGEVKHRRETHDTYDHTEIHWGTKYKYYNRTYEDINERKVTRYRHYRCSKCGELFTRRSFTFLD